MFRRNKLINDLHAYNKPSHVQAIKSVDVLKALLQAPDPITYCFQNDITSPNREFDICCGVNIVITDLPHGNIVTWKSSSPNPVENFFEHIYDKVDPHYSIIAIAADKKQKLKHEKFLRLQSFRAGKRQVALFEPIIE